MKTVVWFGFVLGAFSAAGKVIVSKPGMTVTFECVPNSQGSQLEWRYGNEQIIVINSRGFTRKGTIEIVSRSTVRQTKLQISNVKEEDAGKFTCLANGQSQQHTLFVVSVSASPSSDLQPGSEASLQCQVKGPHPDVSVQWKRPDGSAHTGSHIVQLKPVQHSDAGTWLCVFSHEEVSYNEELNIVVKEPTPETSATVPSKKSNDPNCPNCVTHPPPGDKLLGVSWWIWVLVGVGCLVVLLLTVIVICLCMRIKRKKRKLQKMKNGRQLLRPKQYCECNRPTAAAKPQQGRRRENPSAPRLQPLLME